MLNLKSFERFENENIYIPINVHNQLTEGTHFGEDVFKKIINFTNQNVLIIGCPDFKKELGHQKSIVCINFDDIIEDKDSLNVDLKLFKTFDGKNDMSSTVTSSILKYLKGKTFDKIFNFSIITGETTLNYELVAKFNQWIFEHYFIQGLTSWYSFDEVDVQNQFEILIGEKKKGKKKIYTGYKVNTLGVFNKDVWRSYGFEDGSERILTRVVSDKTETYKTAQELEDEESTSGAEKIDTGNILRGVVEPSIYTFDSPSVNAHIGGSATKVGDTSRDVNKRMEEWKHVFPDLNLIKSYSAVVRGVDDSIDGRVFRDHSIHKILGELGYYNLKRSDFPDKDKYSHEFFKDIVINDKQDDVQTAIDMFYDALRDHRTDIIAQLKSVDFHKSEFALPIHDKDLPYKERDLQTDTINNFKRQIAVGDKEMLMYAVMRFGKTYTACRCVQEMENNRFTVIVSAKADVKYEWVDQVNPYKEFENYDMYFVKGDVEGLRANLGKEYKNLNEYLDANPQKHIMLFITLQDLDGYTKGNKKDEYAENFNFFQKTHIDLLIIDEAHYGAQGKSYGLGIQEGDAYDEEGKLDARAKELIENSLTLDNTVKLHLSGTPYDLVARGKFSKESTIASFGFDDLIRAKKKWDDTYREAISTKTPVDGKILTWEDNPYFGIPDMKIFGYNFDEFVLKKVTENGVVNCTNLFRLSDKKYRNGVNRFLYEDDILHMFKDIDGSNKGSVTLPLLDLPAIKKGNMCKHIVIVLPHRNICDSMEEFLREHLKKDLKNLKNYRIVNIAGEKHHMSTAEAKREIAQQAEAGNKTISLTVKQMLTGVSVKEWDTMFYLKDGESPQEFDQARFRIQTPYVKKLPIYEITDDLKNVEIVKDENGDDKIIKIDMKPQTIFVDFALDRTYSIMYERAKTQVDAEGESSHGDNEDEDEGYEERIMNAIKKELEYIPLIAYNGDKLVEIDYINAYKKATEIHDANMWRKCGGDYLGYLEKEIDFDELYDRCKDIDMSDFRSTYKGGKKSSGKLKGKMKGGKVPGGIPTDPGSRPPGSEGSSSTETSSDGGDEFETLDREEFASKCNTMIRDILVYILCRNDDMQIKSFGRLMDTMRKDNTINMEQNWGVAINIFAPEHADETDPEEIKKCIEKIQKKLRKFRKIIRRIPSVRRVVDKILFKAESDYKEKRKTHDGIKEVLTKFGKGALGKTEYILDEKTGIIKDVLKDIVIFNNKTILDCYGSKIGEIVQYLDKNYSDFDLNNYYLICRTSMIAELNKVTLKIIMRKQGITKIEDEDTHKMRHMTQKDTDKWLNNHILVFDFKSDDENVNGVTNEETNTTDVEENREDIQMERFETFSEFMKLVNEGKYSDAERAERRAQREAKRQAAEEKAYMLARRREESAYNKSGGIWDLKKAIENKWKDKVKDMKFDYILGNPPYGMDKKGSNKMLHWQIYKTVRDFCPNGKINIVCPMKWHINSNPCFDWVRKDMWEHLASFEFVKSEYFKGPQMDDPAIQYIDMSLTHNKCNLEKFFDIDGGTVKMKISNNKVEQKIEDILFDKDNNMFTHIIRVDNEFKKDIEHETKFSEYLNSDKIDKRFSKKYYINPLYTITKDVNLFSKINLEQPILTKDEEKEYLIKNNSSSFHIFSSNDKSYLENLKYLMTTWIIRYGFDKLDDKRGRLPSSAFYMFPDINYAEIVSKVIEYTESNSSIDKSRISTESGLATDYALLWYMIYKKGLQDKYNNDDVNEILDYVNGGVKPSKLEDSSPSSSEPSKSPSEMTLDELKVEFKKDYDEWFKTDEEEDFETWLKNKYPGMFIRKDED